MRRFLSSLAVFFVALLLVPSGLATATPTDSEIMAYCTAQDVQDAYPNDELASITGDADRTSIDTGKIEEAVDDYGAYMVRHVRMQHPDNPFDGSDEFLNGLNVEGAYLTLQKRTPGGGGEQVRNDLDRLDKILMRIATKDLDLMDQTQIDEAPSEPLKPSNLIQQGRTDDGEEFGLHRDLPSWLSA